MGNWGLSREMLKIESPETGQEEKESSVGSSHLLLMETFWS